MDTRPQSGTRPAHPGQTSVDGKVEAAAKSAHEAVDRSAQVLHEATDALAARSEHLRELQHDALATVNHFVREKPLQAIGLAALAGFLLARAGGR